MAAPLGHDFRSVAGAVAVNDGYHAVVACVAAAAYVHNGEITVGGYALLGVFPDFQTSGAVGGEMHVAECLAPFHGIAANLAGRCRLAAFCAQTRDAVGVKHAAVGGGKRFVGSRRIFCLHGAVGGVFAALGVIPRYLFKRQAALPQSALVGVEAVPKCFIVVDWEGCRCHIHTTGRRWRSCRSRRLRRGAIRCGNSCQRRWRCFQSRAGCGWQGLPNRLSSG